MTKSLDDLQEILEMAKKHFGEDAVNKMVGEALHESGLGGIEIPIAGFDDDIKALVEQVDNLDSSTEKALSEMAKGFKKVGVPAISGGALIHILLDLMAGQERLNTDIAKLTSLIADKH